ncbi:MAG TPA: hypothetical protein VIH76_16185 [Candidatus Acidoferrales bacterium]
MIRHPGLGFALANRFSCLIVAFSALIIAISAPRFSVSLQAQAPESNKTAAPQSAQPQSSPKGARGKKLVLKDGSFHLVREYEIQGDRVRYYSVERSSWEEMPADLVDWDATKQAELAESKENAALLEKVHKDEVQRKTIPVDIDASVEVAPNLFLPEGEGLFLLDHSAITELKQSDTDIAFDKKQFLKQVLIPVPVVPTRHTVSILGTRASLRITNTQPEFYRRTKDQHEPEIYLIRARVRGGKREVENIDTLFDVEMAKRKPISVQTWELEKGLYRLTLSEPLTPGEFALVEVAHAQSDAIYVWDFGVDPSPASK